MSGITQLPCIAGFPEPGAECFDAGHMAISSNLLCTNCTAEWHARESVKALETAFAYITDKRRTLRDQLSKYGGHRGACPKGSGYIVHSVNFCTCGWDDIKKELA